MGRVGRAVKEIYRASVVLCIDYAVRAWCSGWVALCHHGEGCVRVRVRVRAYVRVRCMVHLPEEVRGEQPATSKEHFAQDQLNDWDGRCHATFLVVVKRLLHEKVSTFQRHE